MVFLARAFFIYKNQFLLIICDVKISEIDGLKLLKHLKGFGPRYDDTNDGLSGHGYRYKGSGYGVQDFFKPLTLDRYFLLLKRYWK